MSRRRANPSLHQSRVHKRCATIYVEHDAVHGTSFIGDDGQPIRRQTVIRLLARGMFKAGEPGLPLDGVLPQTLIRA